MLINWNELKIFAMDVDGVLTDNKYYISSRISLGNSSFVTKGFNTRDFHAIEELFKRNYMAIILTQSTDEVIIEQINRIVRYNENWKNALLEKKLICENNVSNKKEKLENILNNKNLEWSNVVYIGDSYNDIGCMDSCRYPCCPSDAIDIIKEKSCFVSDCKGGNAVVEDVINNILNNIDN